MKKNICLFFACSLLSFNYVFSQVIVRGSVIDASTSEPLIGATIIYGKGMGVVTDIDGNLPWFKSFQICNPDGSNCFINEMPVPDSHTYEDGVIFSAYIGDSEIADGEYAAKFAFADGAYNPNDVEYLDVTIGSGGTGCALVGDVNGDATLNILDVVLLVNLILDGGDANCGDVNGDESINILDVVLLVNLILG